MGEVTEKTGESVRLLRRSGPRYGAALRVATVVPIATIGILRASPQHLDTTVPVVAAAVLWTCGYGWWLRRSDQRTRPLAVVADTVVLLGVCQSLLWSGAAEDSNVGWLRLLVTFACVASQWHTSPATGAGMAIAVDSGLVAFLAVGGWDGAFFPGVGWALVAAALSRLAWVLVERAARRADAAAARAELARREARVAEAARADDRELANALHDTAASTLLMVGIGQVPHDAAWLRPQARRDLELLHAFGTPESGTADPTGTADLVELLRKSLEHTPLTVELTAPDRLALPFGVARAIADASGEALTNVSRHAGTGRATVRLRGDAAGLQLDVADDGAGFDPSRIPATRRGVRESVQGRMSRIGGTATITSTPGRGTLVQLEWQRSP